MSGHPACDCDRFSFDMHQNTMEVDARDNLFANVNTYALAHKMQFHFIFSFLLKTINSISKE